KRVDKAIILADLERTRQRTRALITSLPEAALDVPYHPGVNPPLWEMGHAAFFYEVFVFNLLDGTPSYNPAMDDLWDSFHVDHRDRWCRDLFPGREETLAYFDTIYDRMADRIRSRPMTDRDQYLYRYAIYHQNMHIESLIWCRQTVGYPAPPDVNSERPAPGERIDGDAVIPAGRWLIGIPGDSAAFADTDFGFDNEKPRFEVELPAFAISRVPVSNREFQAFVEDGGYRRPELWSFGGRKWLQTEIDVALVHGCAGPLMSEPK
ncbi:unnamed protein product, partial [Ectocarpus sp. 12 AP-2014]